MKTRNQLNNDKIASDTNSNATTTAATTTNQFNKVQQNNNEIPHRSIDTNSEPELVSLRKTFNVLICVTGSVATIKLVELTNKISSMFPRPYVHKPNCSKSEQASIKIKIVMTHNSKHFLSKEGLTKSLNNSDIEIHDDEDEWTLWKKMSDPVLHIELRKWADLCLIAPLDANTMAKIANGISDNLLTCVVRAWDVSKPLVYCPAMNVHMYNHPITREQLCKLQSFGYLRVDCVEKRLACGDFGMGGMASVETIANKVIECLTQPVTSKTYITKPLLHSQPTYPIISTSGNHESTNHTKAKSLGNSTGGQPISSRFKTNNHIMMHHVAPHPINLALAAAKTAQQRARKSNSRGAHIDKGQNRSYSLLDKTIRPKKTGTVTSVQNLKAMSMDKTANCIDETINISTEDDINEFDFDPSKLLEQTMVTDDSMIVNPGIGNSSNQSQVPNLDQGPLFIGGNITKMGGLTPLFNTSKFLALCHNKERGCFTCTICKHDYKNRKSMARHLKEQHVQGNIYECRPCGVSYKRREKLIKHNRERHPDI